MLSLGPRNQRLRVLRHVGFLVLVIWFSASCQKFDTRRMGVERQTLGAEVVRIFCERMASASVPNDLMGLEWKPVCRGSTPPPADAPPRLVVLMANRERLVRAIDHAAPAMLEDDLGRLLGQILPLHDPPNDLLPQNERLLADFLDRLANDRAALDAMARLGQREGYRPLRFGLGVTRPLLTYTDLDLLLGLSLRVLNDRPDDPNDGSAYLEWRELQRILALELATMEPAEQTPPGERRTIDLARELLFSQSDAYSTGTPRWVVMRDPRGMPVLPAGPVPLPFADNDVDGLADIDAAGRFIDERGRVLDVPRPFRIRGERDIPRDPAGRALRVDGTHFYEYLDADRTFLGAAIAEASPLFDPDMPTVLRVAQGLPALLGPDIGLSHVYGNVSIDYVGPDTSSGSLFDLIHAVSVLVPRDETDLALEVSETLVRDHERELAGLIATATYMIDRSDLYPDASLPQPNTFWDDVIALGIDYAQTPWMMDSLIRAFGDPRTVQLGEIYGDMARNRDAITWNPAYPNGSPIGFPLDEPVERAFPDDWGNESLLQRSLALIDGLNGVRVCNKEGAQITATFFGVDIPYPPGGAAECELIDIPNVAQAYALSILGRFELQLQDSFVNFMIDVGDGVGLDVDQLLEEWSGIDGLTRHPTPQALNRLVFWGLATDPSTGGPNSEFCGRIFDPIQDRHGNDVIETFDGTIFSWERPGFYEGMSPLLEVLHYSEYQYTPSGEYRFGQLIGTLHAHWATPDHWYRQDVDPALANYWPHLDGVRAYEENIADGLVEGRLLEHLQENVAALESIDTASGYDGVEVISGLAETMIDPDRNRGLTTRDGRGFVEWNDGSDVFETTPLLLLLDGLRAMDRDLDRTSPEIREAWRSGRGHLARELLATRTVGDDHELAHPRVRALLLAAIPFLRERIADHWYAGDLDPWSQSLVTDSEEQLSGPLASAGIQFFGRLTNDPEARDALSGVISYLLANESPNDAFESTLLAIVDQIMLADDETNRIPIAHAMSRALAANAPEVVAGTEHNLDLDSSLITETLILLREVQRVDDRSVLRVLLSNVAQLPGPSDPANDDAASPLDEILDVLSLINRASPGTAGPYDPDDYVELFHQASDVLRDEHSGLQRVNRILSERVLR